MRFVSYFYASVVAALSMVAYAIYTKEQFYPTILFLVTSKVSFVIMGNMIIASALLIGRVSKSVFLGSLRDAEVELLIERSKYTFTETCLALTIFRNELSPTILALFGALLFLKAFHWLSSSRIDYLEQVMPVAVSTHLRLVALIILLAILDVWMTVKCISHTITNGRSVMILFGFEFGLLIVSVFSIISRYILHVIDSRLTSGLASKGLYIMLVDLICDAMKFVTYVFFFCLVFVYYGLPIHIIREVWMAFYAFQKRLSSFIKYLRLTQNLDQRFETATEEELAAAGDCLICREAMERGKKLPCSHVFHLDCLRMWLQHQQSCPLCRADIPVSQAAADTARAQAAAAADAAEARAAGQPEGEGVGVEEVHAAGAAADAGAAGAAVGSAAADANINLHMDNPELRQHQLLAGFPKFFVVVHDPRVELKSEPRTGSPTVRTIANGTVVFVLARVEGTDSSHWLQLADGWVRERTFLLGVLGPPHLLPYDPAIDGPVSTGGSATRGSIAHGGVARGATAAATAAPVPAPTAANARSAALASELANIFARPAVSANAAAPPAATPNTAAAAAAASSAIPTPPPFSANLGAMPFSASTTGGTTYTAPYGLHRPGEGWGAGTTLDRMIGVQEQLHTLQSGVQSLYLAMEVMQESLMACESTLAELLNDQVKQYERVHDLRRHVAEGRNLVDALALAHQSDRFSREDIRMRAESFLQAQASLGDDLPIRAVEGGSRVPPDGGRYFTVPPRDPLPPSFPSSVPVGATAGVDGAVGIGDVGEEDEEDVYEDIDDDEEADEEQINVPNSGTPAQQTTDTGAINHEKRDGEENILKAAAAVSSSSDTNNKTNDFLRGTDRKQSGSASDASSSAAHSVPSLSTPSKVADDSSTSPRGDASSSVREMRARYFQSKLSKEQQGGDSAPQSPTRFGSGSATADSIATAAVPATPTRDIYTEADAAAGQSLGTFSPATALMHQIMRNQNNPDVLERKRSASRITPKASGGSKDNTPTDPIEDMGRDLGDSINAETLEEDAHLQHVEGESGFPDAQDES